MLYDALLQLGLEKQADILKHQNQRWQGTWVAPSLLKWIRAKVEGRIQAIADALGQDEDALWDYQERIAFPGKFDGEEPWVPYLYDAMLNGWGEDLGRRTRFTLDPKRDLRWFPELASKKRVYLWEDDQGFVHANTT